MQPSFIAFEIHLMSFKLKGYSLYLGAGSHIFFLLYCNSIHDVFQFIFCPKYFEGLLYLSMKLKEQP